MAELVRRAGRGLRLLIGTVAVAACSATPVPPAHPTAVAACMDALGSGWQVAVEVDRPASSTLALISGDSIATCQTGKNTERTSFDNTATGVGLYPNSSPPVLSYLTSAGPDDKTSFLVGRVPPTASAVRVAFADGSEQNAVLGGGLWLAWLEQPADATPVAIEAFDAAGTVISRLADTDGIEPGR